MTVESRAGSSKGLFRSGLAVGSLLRRDSADVDGVLTPIEDSPADW